MKKIITILLILFCLGGNAQYIQLYSQYMFTQAAYNSAYFGMDNALSITALHRSHWMGIEGGPKTTFFNAQVPLWNLLGLGVSVMDDSSGPFSQKTIQAGFAYHLNIRQAKLSLGVSPGLKGVRIDLEKVKLSQATDPSFTNFSQRYYYPVLGYGIYFKNKNLSIGVSVPQIPFTKNEFLNLGTHYFGSLDYQFKVGQKFKLKTSVLAKYVEGSPVQIDLSQLLTLNDKVWVGVSYRSNAVINAMVGVFITPQIKIGIAYGYALTMMNDYSRGNSEIFINYNRYYNESKVVTPRFF